MLLVNILLKKRTSEKERRGKDKIENRSSVVKNYIFTLHVITSTC